MKIRWLLKHWKAILGLTAIGTGAIVFLLPSGQPTCVVVLGISDKAQILERLQAALQVVKTSGAKTIILSGHGAGIDGLTEADWMATQIKHIEHEIIVENKSWSTASNVKNVANLIPDNTKAIIVSNHEHVKSAAWCLRWKYGKDAYYVQCREGMEPILPSQNPPNCERAGCC